MGGPEGKWVLGDLLPSYDSSTTVSADNVDAAVDYAPSEQQQIGLRPPQEQEARDELPTTELRLRGDNVEGSRNARNPSSPQQQQQQIAMGHTAPHPEISSPVPVEGASAGGVHREAQSAVNGMVAPWEERRSLAANIAGAKEHVGDSPDVSSSDPAHPPLFKKARAAPAQPQRYYSMIGAATAPWERHTRGFGSRILRVSARGGSEAEEQGRGGYLVHSQ